MVLTLARQRTEQWFGQRTEDTGPDRRARGIAMVALTRCLAIAIAPLRKPILDGLEQVSSSCK